MKNSSSNFRKKDNFWSKPITLRRFIFWVMFICFCWHRGSYNQYCATFWFVLGVFCVFCPPYPINGKLAKAIPVAAAFLMKSLLLSLCSDIYFLLIICRSRFTSRRKSVDFGKSTYNLMFWHYIFLETEFLGKTRFLLFTFNHRQCFFNELITLFVFSVPNAN